MNNITGIIQQSVRSSLEALRNRIVQNHQAAGQVASGRTISSLMLEDTPTGVRIIGRQAIATLEDGRAPGATPEGFVGIIKQWILDKGIAVEPIPYIRRASANWQPKYSPEERGLNTMAGAIAHKIRTEGTSLYQQGGRGDIFTDVAKETTAQIKKNITAIVKQEAINSINNTI